MDHTTSRITSIVALMAVFSLSIAFVIVGALSEELKVGLGVTNAEIGVGGKDPARASNFGIIFPVGLLGATFVPKIVGNLSVGATVQQGLLIVPPEGGRRTTACS